MGEQDVARRQPPGQALRQTGKAAKERDLKAVARRLGQAQPAGGVPPLDAGVEVGAVVTRQHDGAAAPHTVGGCRQGAHRQAWQQSQGAAP